MLISSGALGAAADSIRGGCAETAHHIMHTSKPGSYAANYVKGATSALGRPYDMDDLLVDVATRNKTVYAYVSGDDPWANPLGTIAAIESASEKLGPALASSLVLSSMDTASHCGMMNFPMVFQGLGLVSDGYHKQMELQRLVDFMLNGSHAVSSYNAADISSREDSVLKHWLHLRHPDSRPNTDIAVNGGKVLICCWYGLLVCFLLLDCCVTGLCIWYTMPVITLDEGVGGHYKTSAPACHHHTQVAPLTPDIADPVSDPPDGTPDGMCGTGSPRACCGAAEP